MADTDIPEITAQEAYSAGQDLLLDVREQDEWQAGHAPGALHIPLSTLGSRVDELPAAGRIMAICRMGGRSRTATGALIGAGFHVVNVEGGMLAWAAEDLPIVADDGLPGTVI